VSRFQLSGHLVKPLAADAGFARGKLAQRRPARSVRLARVILIQAIRHRTGLLFESGGKTNAEA
jgi:hypothetical protein